MPRPSVALDTNVVVSAHLKEYGLERFVLDLVLAEKLNLFVSAKILDEYAGVLSRRKFHLDSARIAPNASSRQPRIPTITNSWNALPRARPIIWSRATSAISPKDGGQRAWSMRVSFWKRSFQT